MDKKKLLITGSTFPRWKGDTEPRFVLDYAKAMTEFYDVHVLVPMAPGALKEEDMEGVKVHRFHYFPIHKLETLCYPGAIVPRIKEKKARVLLVPFLFLSMWGKLLSTLSQYDIVHAHWIIPQGIVQSCFKKPYILTGHGGDVTSLNKGVLKALKRRSILRAKGVTVVSSALKDEITKLCPEKDYQVISMGCDTSKFSPSNSVTNYFNQGDKKVILFVGRLAEKKGVTYLIEAMKNVDAMLAIVGSGPLEAELKEQAKELGDKVVFLGAKTHDELNTIFASADVFACPSVTARDGDKEGVPTTIVEAMASGVPVVGTRHSGIPELINDGVNGLLVEERDVSGLTDCINKLLISAELRDKFIANGIKTAKSRDYSAIAKRYYDMIEDSIK